MNPRTRIQSTREPKMPSEEYTRCKNTLLTRFFEVSTSQSGALERFNFWFLNLLGVTVVVLFSQLDKLNLYFRLDQISLNFITLAFTGFCGAVSQYFAYMTKNYVNSYESFNHLFESTSLLNDLEHEDFQHLLQEDFPLEVQNRISPKFLKPLFGVFYKLLSQSIDKQLPYELAAKFTLWQALFLWLEVFSYSISIIITGLLFLFL